MKPLWSPILCLSLAAAPVPGVPGFRQVPLEGQRTYRAYGPDEGLDSLGITAMQQDREGFLWLATDLGLYRYDGVRFRHFSRKQGLASDNPAFLWADPRGGVWVGAGTHLQFVQGNQIQGMPQGWNLPDRLPGAMCRDAEGHLWIALSRTGFFREMAPGRFEPVSGITRPQTLAYAPRHGGVFLFGWNGRVELHRPGQAVQVWSAKDGLGLIPIRRHS